jgi:hypothetical protein
MVRAEQHPNQDERPPGGAVRAEYRGDEIRPGQRYCGDRGMPGPVELVALGLVAMEKQVTQGGRFIHV